MAAYMQQRGVSVIILLRRNTLKRLISILANAYDRQAKLLNGTHKSHVHSEEEVRSVFYLVPDLPRKVVSLTVLRSGRLSGRNVSRVQTLYRRGPSRIQSAASTTDHEPCCLSI